jgi:hypothetical protein
MIRNNPPPFLGHAVFERSVPWREGWDHSTNGPVLSKHSRTGIVAHWEPNENAPLHVSGRTSHVACQRSKIEGRRSKIEGLRSKVENRGSKIEIANCRLPTADSFFGAAKSLCTGFIVNQPKLQRTGNWLSSVRLNFFAPS